MRMPCAGSSASAGSTPADAQRPPARRRAGKSSALGAPSATSEWRLARGLRAPSATSEWGSRAARRLLPLRSCGRGGTLAARCPWGPHESTPPLHARAPCRSRGKGRRSSCARRCTTVCVMRGFQFDSYISDHGGVMSRAELLAAGWSADDVRLGVHYGMLRRLCRGWYGSSDLPAMVRAAWRHGGPLACVSALEFLGAIDPIAIDPPGASPRDSAPLGRTAATALHICRPARAHRLRYTGEVTIHWSDDAVASGTRWCVSREVALDQARRCTPGRVPNDEWTRPA